ncbi:MAG: TrkH family potassium uptake protein [Candidatus Hydrogenedentota bacterium]|nr:MAG: TrkH family potassium uptake protein [Candidatus Hydrogenedentota bacterium]
MTRTTTVRTVFHLLGLLLIILSPLLIVSLIPALLYGEYNLIRAFLIPSVLSLVTGVLIRKFVKPGPVDYLQSLLVCGMAWIVLSVFACIPFWLGVRISFLDAYFETVSGFTTTGITLFKDVEALQRGILFWRGLIQWLGGLGILTLFLAVTFRSDNTYFRLFSAEAHKIESSRPSPSIFRTVVILWLLYGFFTLCEVLALRILGVSFFDATCHSFTTISTGGFSTYDASIDHFRRTGYAYYRAIEYTIIFFMLLGGVSFLLHYKMITGKFRNVSRNLELRWFIMIIILSVSVILLDHNRHSSASSSDSLEKNFRHTIFTVVSLITTTGYGTKDINEPFFPALSKQIFLVLMFIGGCVGSTGGGIKVLRIAVLLKAFTGQIRRARLPRKAVSELVIENTIISAPEFKRITGLFGGWLFLILVGGSVTALFTDLGPLESISGMFSAVGNIGPCYITVQQMSELPAIVKLTYIFGMLAGRLEILPILLVFNYRAWK